jgi:V/A-type H+-transporting ATPase subunit C
MLGLDNSVTIAFMVVGFAILLVVVLFLSYYNVLMNIVHFAYPNARFKALGTPFIRRKEVDFLLDSTSLSEVSSHLQPWGYDIPSHSEYNTIERELESSNLKNVRSSIASLPDSAKYFFVAFNRLGELRQLKNALRLKRAGESDLIKKKVVASGDLTDELVDAIATSSDLVDAVSKLKGTEFGAAMDKLPEGAALPQIESALERQVFAAMRISIARVDTLVAVPLRRFLGTYIDVINLKYIIRAKQDSLPVKEIMGLMVGEGREFPEWRLKQLAEANDVAEVVKDLEASPYGEAIRGAAAATLTPLMMERELERAFLKTVIEISTEHTLTVGPAVKYFASKEYELSNLKALLQRIVEALPPEFVEPLLTVVG